MKSIVKRLRRLLENEDGIALATVVCMISVLTVLGVVLIDQVTAESNRAASSVRSDAVYQAAEAGINDYIAKLTEDSQYYDHCVAKGESTRLRSDNGALVSHSTSTASCLPGGASFWQSGVRWSYPSGKDWWFGGTGNAYGNSTALRGFAYNLMVTPPAASLGTNYLTIVSTGCKVVDMNATPLQCDTSTLSPPRRTIEVRVRPMTPADFQYIVPDMSSGDPCYASNIYGTMYSPGDLYMCDAHVYGNLEAETLVHGAYSMMTGSSPHGIYDQNHPNIRDVVKNKFAITDFGASPSSIKRLAGTNVPTTDFEDAGAAAWRINFSSNGNVQAWKCVYQSGAPDPASSQPFCGGDLTTTASLSANSTPSAITVSGSTAEFPSSGTIYIGTGSNVDDYTYSSTTATSFKGNTKLSHSHSVGDKVSYLSDGVGITWSVPWYNGVPSVGAIYTGQDAIISWPTAIAGYSGTSQDGSPTSQVNGRFTLASGQDIIIAGDDHYASEPSPDGISGPDDDVLGLISSGNLWLAKYAPNQLWWRAATMALSGDWSDYCARHSCNRNLSGLSQMTFIGTLAYTGESVMQSGNYGYDTDRVYRIADNGSMTTCPTTAPGCTAFDALQFLVPPNYPVIGGMQTTVLFHEVPSGYTPPAVPAG